MLGGPPRARELRLDHRAVLALAIESHERVQPVVIVWVDELSDDTKAGLFERA